MALWMKLETWARITYGEDAPDPRTLRRWAADGNIYPPAELHGKCWYVRPQSKYCSTAGGSGLERMSAYYGSPTT